MVECLSLMNTMYRISRKKVIAIDQENRLKKKQKGLERYRREQQILLQKSTHTWADGERFGQRLQEALEKFQDEDEHSEHGLTRDDIEYIKQTKLYKMLDDDVYEKNNYYVEYNEMVEQEFEERKQFLVDVVENDVKPKAIRRDLKFKRKINSLKPRSMQKKQVDGELEFKCLKGPRALYVFSNVHGRFLEEEN